MVVRLTGSHYCTALPLYCSHSLWAESQWLRASEAVKGCAIRWSTWCVCGSGGALWLWLRLYFGLILIFNCLNAVHLCLCQCLPMPVTLRWIQGKHFVHQLWMQWKVISRCLPVSISALISERLFASALRLSSGSLMPLDYDLWDNNFETTTPHMPLTGLSSADRPIWSLSHH